MQSFHARRREEVNYLYKKRHSRIVKIRAEITGPRVHDVGYRPFLVQAGFELGLEGLNVRNVVEGGEQTVLVLAEGEEEEVREFTEFMKSNRPGDAEVKEIKFEEYSNHVPPIERAVNFQLLEQINKGIPAILELRETGEELKKIGYQMLGKQDQMLGKQDETLHEIKGVRQDLKSYMNKRFDHIEKELTEMKKALKDAGIRV